MTDSPYALMETHDYALVSYDWRAYTVTVLVKNTPKDIARAKRAISRSIAQNYRMKLNEVEIYDGDFRVDGLNVAPATKKIEPEWL